MANVLRQFEAVLGSFHLIQKSTAIFEHKVFRKIPKTVQTLSGFEIFLVALKRDQSYNPHIWLFYWG